MSAIPIGIPGCPEFAFCTASIAKKRIQLANCDTFCVFILLVFKIPRYLKSFTLISICNKVTFLINLIIKKNDN